jgi:multidrug efflux pump subunit AcrB
MNNLIAWFARNSVAANMLMLTIIICGLLFAKKITKEIIPNIEENKITINIALSGASVDDAERLLCTPIEQALFNIHAIKRIRSTASSSQCNILIDIADNNQIQQISNNIETSLQTVKLPTEASKPIISINQADIMISRLSVLGDADYNALRYFANKVADDLQALGLRKIKIRDQKQAEIHIEVSSKTLQQYQLSFAEIAQAIQQNAHAIPTGKILSQDGALAVIVANDNNINLLAEMPIRHLADGSTLSLSDVGNIRHTFSDSNQLSRINGKPAISISVYQDSATDLINTASIVKRYVTSTQASLPSSIELLLVQDNSQFFSNRMDIIQDNALSGLALIFMTLLFFLRLRLAFWVTAGIPTAFLGGILFLYLSGGSLNMITTFGLLLVLGIVVDDAIIMGENIYQHQQSKNSPLEGAISGAQEIAKPVLYAVATTALCFVPLLFVPGSEGKLLAQIPLIIIATLIFSLIEALFILPAHLAHKNSTSASTLGFNIAERVDIFILGFYRPFLSRVLHWRYTIFTLFISIIALCFSLIAAHWVKIDMFSSISSEIATAHIEFPKGTHHSDIQQAILKVEKSALKLKKDLNFYYDQEQISHIRTVILDGAYSGDVYISLASSQQRKISTQEVLQRWQEDVGGIPYSTEARFTANFTNSNEDFAIKLYSSNNEQLLLAENALINEIKQYPHIENVKSSLNLQEKIIAITLKPHAIELGLTLQNISAQLHSHLTDTIVLQMKQGTKNQQVILRLPSDEKDSIGQLEQLPIRINTIENSNTIPLIAVAKLSYQKTPTSIVHEDGKRSVFITADLNLAKTHADDIYRSINHYFKQHLSSSLQDVHLAKSGIIEQANIIQKNLAFSFTITLLVMFLLMAMLFASYFQPLLILSAVPFGLTGAILGHLLLGQDLTIWSVAGMIAVSGIVVNDNMVMIFYINQCIEKGENLYDAIVNAGIKRFRPIMLTTITTFFGVLPFVISNNWDAQFLIPMAISISFGVLFATLITLFFIPTLYLITDDLKNLVNKK